MSLKISKLTETCALCFSRDRRLRPISAAHWDLLDNVLDCVPLEHSALLPHRSQYALCWECSTQLSHAAEFTRRVQRGLRCFESYLSGKKSPPAPQSRLAVSRACRTELPSADVTSDVTCDAIDAGTYHVVDSELKREDLCEDLKEEVVFLEPDKCIQELSEDIAPKQEVPALEPEPSRTEQSDQEDSIAAEDFEELLEETRVEEKIEGEPKKKKEVKKKGGKSEGKAPYSRQWMSTEQALRWYETECRDNTSDPSVPSVPSDTSVTSVPSVVCALCRRSFSSEDELRRHTADCHHESVGPYECSICRHRFAQQTTLLEHTERHYVLYTCHACQHGARTQARAREHAATCTQVKSKQDGKERRSGTKRKGDSNSAAKRKKEKRDSYQCRRCKEVFQSFSALRSHRASCSTYKCDKCEDTFSNSGALYRHARAHRSVAEPLQYCATCDTHYKSSWYKKHFEISLKHVTRDAYKHECPHCKRRFLVLRRLKEHIGSVHLKLGIHKCDRCPKSYMNEKVLKMHQAKIHSVDKVEKKRDKICEHCGKGFTCNLYLSNHRRSHTGERPFTCALCGRAFAQSGTLYTHIKTVHRKRLARDGCTDCPGYQCEECGKQFVTNARLKAHYNFYHLKDTDYKCTDCDKMFISVAALKCHRANRHATLTTRSLACATCGKEFRTASARHTHMKTPRPGGVYCV